MARLINGILAFYFDLSKSKVMWAKPWRMLEILKRTRFGPWWVKHRSWSWWIHYMCNEHSWASLARLEFPLLTGREEGNVVKDKEQIREIRCCQWEWTNQRFCLGVLCRNLGLVCVRRRTYRMIEEVSGSYIWSLTVGQVKFDKGMLSWIHWYLCFGIIVKLDLRD